MTKRKLSHQQERRISSNRARRGATSATAIDQDTLLPSGELGPQQSGRVIAYYGHQADVIAEDDSSAMVRRCHLRAHLEPVATGDRVTWCDGNPFGIVTGVEPRSSVLERPDANGRRRLVAANIQRIAIVVAPVPLPHANLIDRYLVAAESQHIQPLLIANKADLPADALQPMRDLLARYPALGYQVLWVSAKTGSGLDALAATLAPHTSVVVGQSGVGKSSLINALQPTACATVGALSEAVTKGRHTTTNTRLFKLPNGGCLIDSPGIREFGLWHLDATQVFQGFIEFAPHLDQCRFRDCRHANEPDCALLAALARRQISLQRLESCRQIVTSLAAL
jgi:ribosome biogenesis GTPase